MAEAAIRAAPTCPSTSKAKTWNPVERSHRGLMHTQWREPTGTHDFYNASLGDSLTPSEGGGKRERTGERLERQHATRYVTRKHKHLIASPPMSRSTAFTIRDGIFKSYVQGPICVRELIYCKEFVE